MRVARVARPDGPAFVEVLDDHVVLLDGHPFGAIRRTDQAAPLESVRLLAPIIPTKILCVGRNYAGHAAELDNQVPDEPLIFLKPTTAVIGPGDDIVLPALSNNVHHEGELVAVIGRLTRNVPVEEAAAAVFGYTCGNDVTARDIQRSDKQWTRGKGFDTFCPLGPFIHTSVDPSDGLTIECSVNGEVRQHASTKDLIFDIAQLVAYCAAFTTLLPGDVIMTGTPAGVGQLHDGDTVTVSVEGVGELTNQCKSEA